MHLAGKSKSSHNDSINHIPLPYSNSAPSIKDDKLMNNLVDVSYFQTLFITLEISERL